MGELHLEVYVERMKREYSVACTTGKAPTAGQSLNGRTSISRTRSARNWLCRADGVGCRVIGSLNQRRGTILDSEVRDEELVCTAEVPLSDMFGYSSQLRGVTQGKGEFSMEYRVSTLALFQRTWSLYFFPLDAPACPPECSEGFVRGLPEDVASGKKIE